jgi:hypothetical protein
MAEIKNYDASKPKESANDMADAEYWIVRAGDSISLLLQANEFNQCEFIFYYNDEKIGYWLLDNYRDAMIKPFAEFEGGNSRLFFNISQVPIKVGNKSNK